MLIDATLNEIENLMTAQQSFVLNIIASWCPDCTERQATQIDGFADRLQPAGLDVYQLNVQDEKRVYLNDALAQFVAELGGHGFPRTVLFHHGKPVDADNVEVFTEDGLKLLAGKFSCLMNV